MNPATSFSPALTPNGPLLLPKLKFSGSATPRVAVVDNFSKRCVDVDGDGIPDLSHGVVIGRLLHSLIPGIQVEPFNLSGKVVSQWDCREIAEQLQHLVRRIRRGERFDAINLSLAAHVPLRLAFPDGKPRRENTDETLKRLSESGWKAEDDCAREVVDELNELLQFKIPVYIGAGNEGAAMINLYGLPSGSVHVGATDAAGKKTDYTADNPLVNRFAQGTFNIYKTAEGFDLNGDGKPDILAGEVSGQGNPLQSPMARFINRPLEECLIEDSHFGILHNAFAREGIHPARVPFLNERVFPLDRLLEMQWIGETAYRKYKKIGDYAVFHQGRIATAMRTDLQGRLIYSPDGSRKAHAEHFILGTSLATPKAIAEDLLH